MKKSLSSKSFFSLGRSRSSRSAATDADVAESDMHGLTEIEKARQDIMLAYLEAHAGNDDDAPALDQQDHLAEETPQTYQATSEYSHPTEEPAPHVDVPDDTAALEQDVPEVTVPEVAATEVTTPEVPAIDPPEPAYDTVDKTDSDVSVDQATGYCLSCTTALCDSQNCFKSELMNQIVADDIAAHRQTIEKNRLS